jgi:hypothetical protein
LALLALCPLELCGFGFFCPHEVRARDFFVMPILIYIVCLGMNTFCGADRHPPLFFVLHISTATSPFSCKVRLKRINSIVQGSLGTNEMKAKIF